MKLNLQEWQSTPFDQDIELIQSLTLELDCSGYDIWNLLDDAEEIFGQIDGIGDDDGTDIVWMAYPSENYRTLTEMANWIREKL